MQTPNTTPNDIKLLLKNPYAYTMLVAVSLLWFFVGKFGDSSEDLAESLRAEVKAVRAESAAKDLRIENLTDAILYYRGVNIKIREEAEAKADSLVRAKVGKTSLEIVRKNKND